MRRGGEGHIDALLTRVGAEAERATHRRRNVFLSFVMEDLHEVNALIGPSQPERTDVAFHDWSVRELYDSVRADHIRQRISERIGRSSVTAVYVSDFTVDSQWVQWEIEEPVRQGKALIAVHKDGRPPARLPQGIRDAEIAVVPWSRFAQELDRM